MPAGDVNSVAPWLTDAGREDLVMWLERRRLVRPRQPRLRV